VEPSPDAGAVYVLREPVGKRLGFHSDGSGE
jgi:hypothetical protein